MMCGLKMAQGFRKNARISAGALACGGAIKATKGGVPHITPALATAYIARDISFHNALPHARQLLAGQFVPRTDPTGRVDRGINAGT